MARELETIHAIEARTGLLAQTGPNIDYLRNAAAFTALVAWELREQGYGRMRKTGGTNCDGMDCDKIQNRNTGEVFDVVINAGIAGQRPAFQAFPSEPIDRWMAPVPPAGQQPPGPAPPPGRSPTPGPVDDITAVLSDIHEVLVAMESSGAQQAQELGKVNATLAAALALAARSRVKATASKSAKRKR